MEETRAEDHSVHILILSRSDLIFCQTADHVEYSLYPPKIKFAGPFVCILCVHTRSFNRASIDAETSNRITCVFFRVGLTDWVSTRYQQLC